MCSPGRARPPSFAVRLPVPLRAPLRAGTESRGALAVARPPPVRVSLSDRVPGTWLPGGARCRLGTQRLPAARSASGGRARMVPGHPAECLRVMCSSIAYSSYSFTEQLTELSHTFCKEE
ncbi:unnamed protein product [Lepidochelys olivacea]